MKEKKEKLYSTGRVKKTRKLTISDRQLTIVQTQSPTNSITPLELLPDAAVPKLPALPKFFSNQITPYEEKPQIYNI
jgi:hypothetical protein